MQTSKIEHITIGELVEFAEEISNLDFYDAILVFLKFRQKHNITDFEALNAYEVAMEIQKLNYGE